MASPMFSAVIVAFGLFSAFEVSAQTQPAAGSPSSQQPVYTLHADKRVVLTDVTVTDRHGNPIHGLNASDFQISDDGKKQDLASFEEHSGPPVEPGPPAETKPGVYSNDFLKHPPPVFNVLLIDLVSMRDDLPRQMALYYELTQFVKHHKAGEPLAIYMRWGPYLMLLQNFTSDQELLLAAVNRALPRFRSHEGRVLSEIGVTHELALDLGKLPGRKDVFWFCAGVGGDPFRPDPTTLGGYANLRVNYDELEAGRIAIYPIDARGVYDPGKYATSLWYQHVMMTNVAEATGGHAVYNENFVGEAAQRLIDFSNDFYTLTYSPREFRTDNSWHKVKVDVKGKTYTLSYRHGYFADGNDPRNKAEDTQPARSRAKLLPNGEVAEMQEVRGPAIVFQARVLPASGPSPAPAKKGTIPYTIRYTLPLDKFVMRNVDGKQQASMGIASMAFDGNGRSTAKLTQQVTATFTKEELSVNGQPAYTFEQPIDLKDGENYLYLGVWDVNTGQFGTIQLSLDAKRPKPEPKQVQN